MLMFVFVSSLPTMKLSHCGAPVITQGHPVRAYFFKVLFYANFDFVCSGKASYLDWHEAIPFYFVFIFTATRSFALRERGLKTSSWSSAVTGLLVSNFRTAS